MSHLYDHRLIPLQNGINLYIQIQLTRLWTPVRTIDSISQSLHWDVAEETQPIPHCLRLHHWCAEDQTHTRLVSSLTIITV